MVRTRWRAVAVGFVIIFATNVVSVLFQPLALLGGLFASVVGGWAAGYLARSGATSGAWNGFLAGSVGGLLAVVVFVALGVAVSMVQLSLGGVFASVTAGLAVLVFVVVGAIPATAAGYVGGSYGPEESDDVSRPAA